MARKQTYRYTFKVIKQYKDSQYVHDDERFTVTVSDTEVDDAERKVKRLMTKDCGDTYYSYKISLKHVEEV